MWVGVISLLPEMITAASRSGVFGRAVASGLVELKVFNPRDFTADRHRTVDDKPYGGGAGMVMMVEPLREALRAAQAAAPAPLPVVLMSPQGQTFRQSLAVEYSAGPGLIVVCGRYEGIDERFVKRYVDLEWSIGDYVLSGGELPALVVLDAIARHIPGTLGNRLSIIDESHLDGTLDYPHYTRPVEVEGARVPEILLSGDHTGVSTYRRREALGRTFERRPELLTRRLLSDEERELLTAWINLRDDHDDTSEA